MRALKLAGLVSCSLALTATNAAAAPQVLDDVALDNVVAGRPGDLSQTLLPDFPRRPPFGFPSVVETPASTPVLSLELETAEPVETQIPGVGESSTSITTGAEAAIAAQDPLGYVQERRPMPRFPVFPSFPGVR